jgi:hypothetical protein
MKLTIDLDVLRGVSALHEEFRLFPLDTLTPMIHESQLELIYGLVAASLNLTPLEMAKVDMGNWIAELYELLVAAEYDYPDSHDDMCGCATLIFAKLLPANHWNTVYASRPLELHPNQNVRLVKVLSDAGNGTPTRYVSDDWLLSLMIEIESDVTYYRPSRISTHYGCLYTAALRALQRLTERNQLGRLSFLPISLVEILSQREIAKGSVPPAVLAGLWL